jgi:hypothetical protein
MITYAWIFNPLECYPEKDGYADVVFKVCWQLTAVEQVDPETRYTAIASGMQQVPLPSGSFIPYDQLTFEIVQGWVETAMGPYALESLQQSLATEIENQKNPPVVALQAPWYVPTPTP